MIWSKSDLIINCFFALLDSGKKIGLLVYKKSSRHGRDMAGNTEVRYLLFGAEMELAVEANVIRKPILTNVVVRHS